MFFYILYKQTSFSTLYVLCFQQAGEIDNLTVKLGQSNLVVLCVGSTLVTESMVLRRTKFHHQHLQTWSYVLLVR